ncbi:MAG TPA: tRNA pseudouridine(55) synthase TruB [Euzebyales bacterium]|nr:tRNA pseudouridine(55) synthase TruB [Euzebyales bacterium]
MGDEQPRLPDGVVIVDKPAGMTSHDVVQRARRALGRAYAGGRRRHGHRVGHTGTLDPAATGVLVVCVGRATRLVPFLQAGRKTYDARMQLGRTTTTLDAEGEVVAEHDAAHIDEQQVCEALKHFVGPIEQIPPMVSAVKVDGERLHVRARRGEQVERAPRPVVIHDLVLEDFVPGSRAEVGFLVSCSAGTYVRTLADDIGRVLGVGGHLTTLRRLASGGARIGDAVTLEDLEAAIARHELADLLVSPAAAMAMADYPTVVLDDDAVTRLSHGRPLPATGLAGPVAAVDAGGDLVAVVEDRDAWARSKVVLASAS